MLLHIDESSSWLLCRRQGPDKLGCVAVVTLKDDGLGRKGFRVLEGGWLGRGQIERVGKGEKWRILVGPEGHGDFIRVVVLGVAPG